MTRITFYILLLSFLINNKLLSQQDFNLEEQVEFYLTNFSDCEGKFVDGRMYIHLDEETIIDCDSAMSTYELNICSGEILCLERRRFDSLNKMIISHYDSLIEEYKNYEFKDGEIDYLNVKNLHLKSIKSYVTYFCLEKQKTSLEFSNGRLNNYYSNYRIYQLLQKLNKDLQNQVDEINL